MNAVVTKTITAQNTFTDWLLVLCDSTSFGRYSVLINGTFVASVVIQWAELVNGVITVIDDAVETFTSPVKKIGTVTEQLYIRCGVKTGGFTSGSIAVRLGQKQ